MTQHQILAKLLLRKRGTTAMEVAQAIGSTCPHKRISEFRDAGWTVVKKPVKGKNFNCYFGTPPSWPAFLGY